MIKLRKKIIRLRKNPWEIDEKELPDDYILPRTISELLLSKIEYLFEETTDSAKDYFSEIVCLWNQGSYCFDEKNTPVHFDLCICEKCDECEKNRCICPLETNEAVCKTTWEFSKLVLDKKQLKEVMVYIGYNPLGKVQRDIAKSRSFSEPSYPKYKKLRKSCLNYDQT